MQQKNSQDNLVLERISEQILALISNAHIRQVIKINDFAFKLQYHPCETLSVYKEKTYSLELVFSLSYPNNAPSLRFTDQIYHLNVGFNSGEVRMAVLEDDWSPFLSLTSLIESLDQVLEAPDVNYALDDGILELYQTNRSKYLNKVLDHVTLDDVVLCNIANKGTHGEDDSELLGQNSEMKDSQLSNQNIQNMSQIMNESKKKNMIVDTVYEKMQKFQKTSKDKQNKSNFKQVMNRNERDENIKQNQNKKSNNGIRQTIDMDVAKSIQVLQYPQNSSQAIMKTKSLVRTSSVDSKINPTLGKINETISSFIEELNEIQGQISVARNQGIISLLRQKYESQLDMLRQLMEISEDAKRKMLKKLKQEVFQL